LAGDDVSNGDYGNMLIKDLPAEYETPTAVKKDLESPG